MQTLPRTFEEIIRAYPGRKLEMFEGEIREKPSMTIGHNRMEMRLLFTLARQVDGSRYEVRLGQAPVRRTDQNYYLPDVYVVPRHAPGTPLDQFEVYTDPLPFVGEVWSPSTGAYDIDQKLPGYRDRGDQEIWRLHPFVPSVTAWRRQPDGSYSEEIFTSGIIRLHALPEVEIDLDDLFDLD